MFQPVEIVWKDQTYTIPANKVLGAIASVESVITLGELQQFAQRGTAPAAKLAMAFGVLLRYAGAAVTDAEIAGHVFAGADRGAVVEAIANLMQLMIPQQLRGEASSGAAGAEGNA